MVEHKGVASIQEIAGEKTVSITHIPPNDWAAIGARLERALRDGHSFSIVQCVVDGRFAAWGSKHIDKRYEGGGKTPLEALNAALDAAEGAKQ